jgi:ABC-2 type transport system ATP-binding protein
VGIINRGRLVTEAPREALLAQYAVSALEVEVDEKSEAILTSWSETLRGEPWVKTINLRELVVRVIVNDIETGKKELLKSATSAGVILNKYEVVRPSLEDVFLQLVGEEEAGK